MAWRIAFRAFSIAILLWPVHSLLAQPADRCSAILADSLLTRRLEKKDSSYQRSEHLWACSASESDTIAYLDRAKRENFSHNGNVGWGQILGIAGDWNYNSDYRKKQNDVRHWKQNNCSEKDSHLVSSGSSFYASQHLSPEQISAWQKCMIDRKDTLTCYAEPSGKNVKFSLGYSTEQALPKIDKFEVWQGSKVHVQRDQIGTPMS